MFVVRVSRDAFDQDLRNRYVEGYLYSDGEREIHDQLFGIQTSCMPADYLQHSRGEALVVTLFGLPGGRAGILASDPRLHLPSKDVEVGFALPAEDVAVVTGLVRYALNRFMGNEDDGIAYLMPEPDAVLVEEMSHANSN